MNQSLENKLFPLACIGAGAAAIYTIYDLIQTLKQQNPKPEILEKSQQQQQQSSSSNNEFQQSTDIQSQLTDTHTKKQLVQPDNNHLLVSPDLQAFSNYESIAQFSLDSLVKDLKQGPFDQDSILRQKVYKICITGNESLTIASTLSYLSERLEERNITVYRVPFSLERSLAGGNNIYLVQDNPTQKSETFASIIKLQKRLEAYFERIANLGEGTAVVLCDRGVMDILAYSNSNDWDQVFEVLDTNLVKLRDGDYNSVIQLASQNKIETQPTLKKDINLATDIQELIDENTITQAWLGHPHFQLLSQDQQPDENFHRCLNQVLKIVGHPISQNNFKKYLIKGGIESVQFPQDLNMEEFIVEEIFLSTRDSNKEEKIRKRTQNNSSTYLYSTRNIGQKVKGQRSEEKRIINHKEYLSLLNQKDSTKMPLIKKRIAFFWEKQPYTIDTILNIPNPFSLLRFEVQDEQNVLEPPYFIQLDRDVTNDEAFNSNFIAQNQVNSRTQ